jgi:ligand-binding sensor domain-containing protein
MQKTKAVSLLYVCNYFLLVCISLFLPPKLPAQDQKGLPFITNYRYQDYNADGVNWSVTEDDKGILYFANTRGILIYDGQHWELVVPPGISETRSTAKGKDGKIYVATNGDIGYLAANNKGKLEFISLKEKLPADKRNFGIVWDATMLDDGRVLFRSNNRIMIWDYKTFQIIESKEGFHMGAEINGEYYNRIWTKGLSVLKNGSFQVVPNGEKFANERIYAMLPYDDKRMLIGTRTQGLFLYDGKDFIPFKTEADPYVANTSLYGGLILSNGLIALNTFNDGMVIINKQGKLIQRIDKSVGLQDNSVDYVYEDSRGILWMPLFNGIAKFDLHSSLTYYNESMGLPAKTVFSVGFNNGTIYAGTNNGAYLLNKATNHFEKLAGTSGQVNTFLKNGKDFLLAGAEKGLLKIDGSKVTPVIPGVNYDFHVTQIMRSKIDSTVLYCDLRSGLAVVRYHPATGKYDIESYADGLFSNVGYFSETPAGDLWIAGDNPGELKLVNPDRSSGKVIITPISSITINNVCQEGIYLCPTMEIKSISFQAKIQFLITMKNSIVL